MNCAEATIEAARRDNPTTYQENLADLVTLSLSRVEALGDTLEHRAGNSSPRGVIPKTHNS